MQRLYDQHDRYTAEASRLDQEGCAALASLFEQYQKLGYSPRDISSILVKVVVDLETEAVLLADTNRLFERS